MSRDTIDLADVHVSFCCGVAQSSCHQAPVQSTPPGWVRTTVGLSTWNVLFMARICSAAGSAWWEELEPSSLHKKLQFSFRNTIIWPLNLFIPVRLVYKEDHSGGGCRESTCRRWEIYVAHIMTALFYLCILNLCLLVWFGRWLYWYLQLSVVSPVLVSWQSAYHSFFSSAEPQSTAYSLSSFITIYTQNTAIIVYGLVASSVGSFNGGYKYRKCHKSDFKWVTLAFFISWSFNATFGIQSVMMFFRVWSWWLVSAQHGERSDGGQLLLSKLSPNTGRLFCHGLVSYSGHVNFTAFSCLACDLMQFGLMCREWAFFQPWILKRKWPGWL